MVKVARIGLVGELLVVVNEGFLQVGEEGALLLGIVGVFSIFGISVDVKIFEAV